MAATCVSHETPSYNIRWLHPLNHRLLKRKTCAFSSEKVRPSLSCLAKEIKHVKRKCKEAHSADDALSDILSSIADLPKI